MANKKLAEENHRWLRSIRAEIAKLQELIVDESIRCTRENPEIEWAHIEKQVDRVKSIATYGRTATERRTEQVT